MWLYEGWGGYRGEMVDKGGGGRSVLIIHILIYEARHRWPVRRKNVLWSFDSSTCIIYGWPKIVSFHIVLLIIIRGECRKAGYICTLLRWIQLHSKLLFNVGNMCWNGKIFLSMVTNDTVRPDSLHKMKVV